MSLRYPYNPFIFNAFFQSKLNRTIWAYGVSYGQAIGSEWAVGASGRYIDARISDVGAGTAASTIGALYRPSSHLSLAATVANLGGMLKFLSSHDPLPLAGHLGAAWRVMPSVLLTTEVVGRRTGLWSGHGGVEWRPLSAMALRAGYRSDTTRGLGAQAGITAGLGLDVWGQELAYAWAPYGDLGSIHYFSFLARFDSPGEGKRNLIRIRPHVTPLAAAIREEGEVSEVMDEKQLMSLLQAGEKTWVASQ